MSRFVWMYGAVAALALMANGCAERAAEPHAHDHEPWAVTAWGERYEIFAEAAPLEAGKTVKSHTHVTILDGFAPLTTGSVSAVLRDSTGATVVFTQTQALRAGIFSIAITPPASGVFDLSFRVESAAGNEEIRSGRVEVGTHAHPGGLVAAPPGPAGDALPTSSAGEPVSFLKEQQWRVAFATDWARPGALNPSVSGPARVRPAAGGEAVIAAPLDGTVAPAGGLYVGLAVPRGGVVAELRPRAGAGRSLAEIESDWELANARLVRLNELHAAEAVSRAELDRAQARATTLRAELDAVSGNGRLVQVTAPFAGRIAEVMVSPGAGVAAGTSLARLVQTDPLWIEIGLSPERAAAVDAALAGLVLQRGAAQAPLSFPAAAVRLVSRAPEVDPATGLVLVIVEVRGAEDLRIGTTVQAELLLPGERPGIVVPAEAVVDDAGVPVVYVQPEGESFLRCEVRLLGRQGDRMLVAGLTAADRIVTRGAATIRRAVQMSTGEIEAHVH